MTVLAAIVLQTNTLKGVHDGIHMNAHLVALTKGVIMSHPVNRKERFLVGVKKSKKRVVNFYSQLTKLQHPEWVTKSERRHRHTTKLCSCMGCGNPRKYFDEKTIQEKRHIQHGELAEWFKALWC